MRRDARAHREALIVAAATCFEEQGYLVPLETIAAKAGVGRGTLYRNFSDRMALALAVFERKGEQVVSLDPALSLEQALTELIRRGAPASASFNRLAAEMPINAENEAALRRVGRRIAEQMAPIVARAQAAGVLPAGFDPDHITLAGRMVSGLLLPHMSERDIEDQITEAIPVIMNGLRAR